MRIGPLEIIVIVIILIVIAVITRSVRYSRNSAKQDAGSPPDKRGDHKQMNMWVYVKRTGIAFVITGILFAVAGISMFRWAIQSYLWAFILMVLGFAVLFLSRKK